MSDMYWETELTIEEPVTRAARRAGGAFGLLFAANPLPMWVYDLETLRFLEVNDAAVAHYGYSRDEFLRMTTDDILPEGERAHLHQTTSRRKDAPHFSETWRHRRADGALLAVEVSARVLDWEGRPASLVVAHDVTEARRLQSELARRGLHDETTGLATASLFVDHTAAALVRAGDRAQVGVVVVGLSGLDEVVAAAGYGAGEALVAEATRRLRDCCRAQEALARLGDGRFAVLCASTDRQEVVRVAASVIAALKNPVAVAGSGELRAAPAVGVAFGDNHDGDAAGLVRDATSAMRHAAERGENSFVVASTELRRAALETLETEQALSWALRSGQLRLVYQPVVDLHDCEVVTCEALVRWQRPGVGLVEPARFVPLAERSGMIVELGAWVIERATAEAAAWPGRTGHRPRVGINLSARHLHDERLVERITNACDTVGLSPSALCIELTESAFVAADDYGTYKVLAALRELGVEVAIDDFGTGFSALSYLKDLPLDVVKIDREFVAGLGTDRADALLVEAITTVAHGLGLRVVAEGVETEAQLEILYELGCDAAQGYLLARPTASDTLPSVLDSASRVAGGRPARASAPDSRRRRCRPRA